METNTNVAGKHESGNRLFVLSCLATLAIIYTMHFAANLLILAGSPGQLPLSWLLAR